MNFRNNLAKIYSRVIACFFVAVIAIFVLTQTGIAKQAKDEAKETNKYMGDILASFGFNVVSALELQIALETEKEKAYNHKQTVKAFDKFIAAIEKGQRNVPLGQIVRFNIFKVISEANKEHFEADYAYYKGKSDFPYEASFFRKKWARLKALKALGEFMANR